MSYRAESIPWEVASGLRSFVDLDHGGEQQLVNHDVALGRDEDGRWYLGLVRVGTELAKLTDSTFTAVIKDGSVLRRTARHPRVAQVKMVIPGAVVRAILAACREREATGLPAKVGTVGWWRSEKVITVMMAPPFSDKHDAAMVGGQTSAGREVHYHVETRTYRVVRTSFAR